MAEEDPDQEVPPEDEWPGEGWLESSDGTRRMVSLERAEQRFTESELANIVIEFPDGTTARPWRASGAKIRTGKDGHPEVLI